MSIVGGIEQWIVSDTRGGQHIFEDADALLASLLTMSSVDQALTLRDPRGNECVIIKRHARYRIHVVREL